MNERHICAGNIFDGLYERCMGKISIKIKLLQGRNIVRRMRLFASYYEYFFYITIRHNVKRLDNRLTIIDQNFLPRKDKRFFQ